MKKKYIIQSSSPYLHNINMSCKNLEETTISITTFKQQAPLMI